MVRRIRAFQLYKQGSHCTIDTQVNGMTSNSRNRAIFDDEEDTIDFECVCICVSKLHLSR